MMMTIETRCLIELSDVLGVEFRCHSCGAKTLLGTNDKPRTLWDCPVCKEPWLHQDTDEAKAIHGFLNRLRDVGEKMKGRDFSLKLLVTSPGEQTE